MTKAKTTADIPQEKCYSCGQPIDLRKKHMALVEHIQIYEKLPRRGYWPKMKEFREIAFRHMECE